jgi:diacylglycerol kinase (ATP)
LQNIKNILFIINPISGGKSKNTIPDDIERYLDHSKLKATFKFTAYIGHAKEIAGDAVQDNFDIIAAAGGDGTINEVASVVLEHQKILAILPLGSGNGLARFLNIPVNVKEAIEVINKLDIKKVDSATFNGMSFFNVAGIGFDAFLSSIFSKNKERGAKAYFFDGFRAILNYKAKNYTLILDGNVFSKKAFAISFANSSQYGNNIYISPMASITDGFLDVCIIKPFNLLKIPYLIYLMTRKTYVKNNRIEIIKAKHIKISSNKTNTIHLDGEPIEVSGDLEIIINPLSLNVIAN